MALPLSQAYCQENVNGDNDVVVSQNILDKNVDYYLDLGRQLKFGITTKQDFDAAFKAFADGVKANSVDCLYELGRMYYVGMGCEQNYETAYQYFLSGLERKHKPSAFMVAMCHKYGFGVKKDLKATEEILTSLSKEGYMNATKELEKGLENETSFDKAFDINRFKSFQKVENSDLSRIGGVYIGDAVIMDYSKQTILDVIPVKLSLTEADNRIEGVIYQDDETMSFSASVTKDNNVRFDMSLVEMNSRLADKNSRFSFENGLIFADNNEVCAELQTKVWMINEIGHPIYLDVRKVSDNTASISSTNVNVSLSAEWVSATQIKVNYNLTEPVEELHISVYNPSGVELSSASYKNVNVGDGQVLVDAKTMEKTVIVKAEGGQINTSVTLIR